MGTNIGEIHAPDPAKIIAKQTSVAPDPEAECPRWMDYPGQAHEGQEEVIDWLWKVQHHVIVRWP